MPVAIALRSLIIKKRCSPLYACVKSYLIDSTKSSIDQKATCANERIEANLQFFRYLPAGTATAPGKRAT